MHKADFNSHINSIPKPDHLSNNPSTSESQFNNFSYSEAEYEPVSEHSHVIGSVITNDNNMETNSGQLNHDPEEIWKIVKEHLRMHISPRDMTVWYTGVYLENISNGVATLSCDNAMKREWIESYNKSFIRNKLEEVIGYKPDLMITLRSSATQANAKKEEKDSPYEYFDPNSDQGSLFSSGNANRTTVTETPEVKPNNNLNPKYLISNFIVGNSNQLAHAVAEGVIENPGTGYNPVFYYGPSGVGKTHLMQAIGNALVRRNPTAKVLYVPIETFMNEMIEAIRTNKNEEFRQKYRPADLLIIDDIQFISTFKKTKEELFNTFNALYEANKQIIIASDRQPHEIENLPDRLRTRFQGGMVVDIQAPDLETRIAILQQEMKNNKAEIPNEIVIFIAQNVENSVRELEGAITKVITLAKVTRQIPTIEEVARMLQVDVESKRRRVKPKDVIDTVSDVFDVTPKDIKGNRRTAYIALSRQVVMYLLRVELELPLEKVAQHVNRKDHTTVLHACDKIEKLLKEDTRLKERVEECKSIFAS